MGDDHCQFAILLVQWEFWDGRVLSQLGSCQDTLITNHPDKTTGVPMAFGLCAQNHELCVCLSRFLDFIYPVDPWTGPARTRGD